LSERDAIAGFVASKAFSDWARVGLVTAAAAGIVLCVGAELVAASAAHAVAARLRVEAIQNEAAFKCDKFEEPKNAGPLKTGLLKTAHDAVCARDEKAAQDRQGERLASARKTSGQKAWLSTLLAILGAIDSSYVTPLLEGLLGALVRGRKA
jgi:hypothetical protein